MKKIVLALALFAASSAPVLAGDVQQPPQNTPLPCDSTIQICSEPTTPSLGEQLTTLAEVLLDFVS
jgi:hypothetical protein